MQNYAPGYDVHFIQTRLAFEPGGNMKTATLTAVDLATNEFVVQTDAGERRYWCTRAADAAEHLDRGLPWHGGVLVLVSEGKHLLALPTAEPGTPPPEHLTVRYGVTELDGGSVVGTPTPDRGWTTRLYNVRLPDDPDRDAG